MVKLSLVIFFILFGTGLQVNAQVKDSSIKIPTDSTAKRFIFKNQFKTVLDSNTFLNSNGKPRAFEVVLKKTDSSSDLFYLFASLFLLLGVLRSVFSRYFTTMFRVFFNTSLRQNQLTDQLEQAAFPSLLFNIFFSVSMGLYIYSLYNFYDEKSVGVNWFYMGICVLAVAVCYLTKFFSLLFTGWLTTYKAEAKIYIFSIFLLNKIIGMLLLPFTIIIAFSTTQIATYAINVSLILLSILLFSRFFRTYGLLQNRLKLNRMHFLIYIVSLEVLPILLIYKTVMVFFGNSS